MMMIIEGKIPSTSAPPLLRARRGRVCISNKSTRQPWSHMHTKKMMRSVLSKLLISLSDAMSQGSTK